MAKISLNIKEPLKAWFVEKSNIVTGWNDSTSDEKVPSEKLVKDGLDAKINVSDRVTSLSSTSTDVQVPSAKCVYDLYESIPKWTVTPVASIEDLPETGVVGTIYLVPEEDAGEKNGFKEYFWNNNTNKYEQFGGVELDISNLVTMKQVVDYIGTNGSLAVSDDGELSLTIQDPVTA